MIVCLISRKFLTLLSEPVIVRKYCAEFLNRDFELSLQHRAVLKNRQLKKPCRFHREAHDRILHSLYESVAVHLYYDLSSNEVHGQHPISDIQVTPETKLKLVLSTSSFHTHKTKFYSSFFQQIALPNNVF